jgi:hypothetical protein
MLALRLLLVSFVEAAALLSLAGTADAGMLFPLRSIVGKALRGGRPETPNISPRMLPSIEELQVSALGPKIHRASCAGYLYACRRMGR